MTNNVSGIGVNNSGVNPYLNPKPQGETKTGENPPSPQAQTKGNNVNPDDVLSYMAQSAVYTPNVNTPKTYNVSKYVTPEQAERIAGFISSFEGGVAEGLLAIDNELGGLNLPDDAKHEIAANMAVKNDN